MALHRRGSQVGIGLCSQEQETGQEETASSCARGGLDWILGKIPSWKEWSGTGPGHGGITIPGDVKKCVNVALVNVV